MVADPISWCSPLPTYNQTLPLFQINKYGISANGMVKVQLDGAFLSASNGLIL